MKRGNFKLTELEQGVILSALNHYWLYNLDRSKQYEVLGTIEETLCGKSAKLTLETIHEFEKQQDG